MLTYAPRLPDLLVESGSEGPMHTTVVNGDDFSTVFRVWSDDAYRQCGLCRECDAVRLHGSGFVSPLWTCAQSVREPVDPASAPSFSADGLA